MPKTLPLPLATPRPTPIEPPPPPRGRIRVLGGGTVRPLAGPQDQQWRRQVLARLEALGDLPA
ncbi:MAG TPA: hypothetical protein VKY74_10070 [Chloroflexia bacterium]|nr:hypothetical protein [Chloroflexia bacterium]